MNTEYILKRLYRYTRPYRRKFIAAVFALSIAGALSPAMITVIKPVMDGIFSARQDVIIPVVNISIPRDNMLYYLSLIILGLSFFKGIFDYISTYYMAYIGQNVTKDIRNRLFRHLMFMRLSYYVKNPTGQLLSRITNDVRYLEDSVVKIPVKLIRDGIQLILFVLLLFYANWKWALIAICGFMFIILPFVQFTRMLKKISRKGHQKMADIYDFLAERISGIRLIKAFSTEKSELRNMRDVNQKFLDVVLKSEKLNAFQAPFIELLSTAGVAVLLILGGSQVLKGNLTPGDFFLFIGYLVGMYTPAKNFSGINQQLQRAMTAAERIFIILDHKEHIVQVENPVIFKKFTDSIKFENVTFSYDEKNTVLNDVNFTIKKGELAAFVGPSGAGKTTLVNLVPRFFEPQKGAVIIDGIDIKEYEIKSLRMKIAMVMQDVILFNMSIRENICYGLGEFTEDEIVKYATAANAHEFITRLPQGYDTVIGERGVKLSGGQRQRLSIARAIIKDPDILILDEATSHLDTESEKQVQDAMEQLMEGRTTLVIAHRLSTVRKAARIMVMERGRIVENGKHEELLGYPGLYRKMFELQSL